MMAFPLGEKDELHFLDSYAATCSPVTEFRLTHVGRNDVTSYLQVWPSHVQPSASFYSQAEMERLPSNWRHPSSRIIAWNRTNPYQP